jgi:hypothetical protein
VWNSVEGKEEDEKLLPKGGVLKGLMRTLRSHIMDTRIPRYI